MLSGVGNLVMTSLMGLRSCTIWGYIDSTLEWSSAAEKGSLNGCTALARS